MPATMPEPRNTNPKSFHPSLPDIARYRYASWGVRYSVEREVKRDADDKSKLYSLVRRNASRHCGKQLPATCSVDVWRAALEDQVISPFIIDGRLTGEMKLRFMKEGLPKIISSLTGEMKLRFMKEGLPKINSSTFIKLVIIGTVYHLVLYM
jgi:hypothetical protein